MPQQLPLLVRGQFVIERHQHSAAKENRRRRNQPLGLICHDDRRTITGAKSGVLQRARQRFRAFLKFAIGQLEVFSLTVGFYQARFTCKLPQRVSQRRSDGLVLGKIQHLKAGLYPLGQRLEIADTLHFVVRQFNRKVVLDARKQF
jgi:hypothetical protein